MNKLLKPFEQYKRCEAELFSNHDIISPLYQKEIDEAMRIIRTLKEQVEHIETII